MPDSLKVFLILVCATLISIAALNYWPYMEQYYQQLQASGQTTKPTAAEQSIASDPSADALRTKASEAAPLEDVSTPGEDPANKLEWLHNQDPSPERLESILEVVALWAANDSENALLWLESNAEGTTRIKSLDRAIGLWAESDPLAASVWIEGMANDASKTAAASALTKVWAETSPQAAATWLSKLPMTPTRDAASSSLLQTWAISNPRAAAEWALSEAETSGNLDLLDQSIIELTRRDPAQAQNWVRLIAENFESPAGLEAYLRTRAQTEPAQTMASILSLSPDDPINSPNNPTIIMEEWAGIDSVTASAWLVNQPASPARDAAIDGFIDAMISYEPQAAAEWSTAFTDPKLRRTRLRDVFANWVYADAGAAIEWLNQSSLSLPEKQTLLKTFNQN